MIKYSAGLLFLLAACISSCTKEDDYKKFAAGGEITYPGRVDTVIVRPGNQRISLKIALGNDPAVTRVKVYWNDRTDSAEMAVPETHGKDTLEMVIDDLPQGQYNFNAFAYDSEGNVSVVENASGTVYGEDYLKALSNRVIKSLQQAANGNVIIEWNQPLAGETAIELKYTGVDGEPKMLLVPGGELVTEVSSYKGESTLYYRSLFLPEPDAIDTFSLESSEALLPAFERQVPKENFKIVILPTDVLEGGYGWLMNYLWDENYGVPGFATQDGDSQWFTFDMGASVKMSRFKTWQANDRLYKDQNAKKFEVWGSNDPDPDGSWDSWTRLMTCESVKPSGLPLGELSDADIAYANGGEEFVFPSDTSPVRYIRIKVLETWGNGTFITMSELTFWTRER